MVNNSTIINKTNNYFSSQTFENLWLSNLMSRYKHYLIWNWILQLWRNYFSKYWKLHTFQIVLRHNIAKILLKLALNINLSINQIVLIYSIDGILTLMTNLCGCEVTTCTNFRCLFFWWLPGTSYVTCAYTFVFPNIDPIQF